MKLLKIYEDAEEARACERLIKGSCRLASERDGNQVIYNLFGSATWSNFYALRMYHLVELKQLLSERKNWVDCDLQQHAKIISSLHAVAKSYELIIPEHWL